MCAGALAHIRMSSPCLAVQLDQQRARADRRPDLHHLRRGARAGAHYDSERPNLFCLKGIPSQCPCQHEAHTASCAQLADQIGCQQATQAWHGVIAFRQLTFCTQHTQLVQQQEKEPNVQGMALLCMSRPDGDCVVETQSDWGYSLGVAEWKGATGKAHQRARMGLPLRLPACHAKCTTSHMLTGTVDAAFQTPCGCTADAKLMHPLIMRVLEPLQQAVLYAGHITGRTVTPLTPWKEGGS